MPRIGKSLPRQIASTHVSLKHCPTSSSSASASSTAMRGVFMLHVGRGVVRRRGVEGIGGRPDDDCCGASCRRPPGDRCQRAALLCCPRPPLAHPGRRQPHCKEALPPAPAERPCRRHAGACLRVKGHELVRANVTRAWGGSARSGLVSVVSGRELRGFGVEVQMKRQHSGGRAALKGSHSQAAEPGRS